ncbi:hypothetical protein Q7P35_004972 [Cladosporium inversicolor]
MSQACPLSRRLDLDELSEQPVWRASKASEGSDEKHDLKMNLEAFANCLSDLQSLYVDKTDGTNASVTPGGNGAGEGKLKSVWSVAFLRSHVDTKQSCPKNGLDGLPCLRRCPAALAELKAKYGKLALERET